MSEKSDSERLAVLETEVKSLKEMFPTLDARLRTIERSVWAGIGIIAFLQFVLK